MSNNSPFYSVPEFAPLAGVHVNTVRYWIGKGRLQAERDEADNFRIPSSELERVRAERQLTVSSVRGWSQTAAAVRATYREMRESARNAVVQAAILFAKNPNDDNLKAVETAVDDFKIYRSMVGFIAAISMKSQDAVRDLIQLDNNPDEAGEVVPDSETIADTLERYDREDAQVE